MKRLALLLFLSQSVAIAAPIMNPGSASNAAKTSDQLLAESAESKPWAVDLRYTVQTDFAEQPSPRLYNHNFTVDGAYEVNDWFTANLAVGGYFKTVGSSISRFPEDSGLAFVDVGVSRPLVKDLGTFLKGKHSVILTTQGSIPMTEESQIEGFRGTVGLSPVLSSKFFDGLLSVNQIFAGTLIFNKYRFSPFDNQPIPTMNYGYSITPSVRIYGNLRFAVGFGIRRTRYTDGFRDFNYQNSQSLTYTINSVTLVLKHTNGGYTDDGNVDLWYVDKYRRLVSAAVGFTF